MSAWDGSKMGGLALRGTKLLVEYFKGCADALEFVGVFFWFEAADQRTVFPPQIDAIKVVGQFKELLWLVRQQSPIRFCGCGHDESKAPGYRKNRWAIARQARP